MPEQTTTGWKPKLSAFSGCSTRWSSTRSAQCLPRTPRASTRSLAAGPAAVPRSTPTSRQLRDTVSDVHSRARDLHASTWGETGIVTFVLEQTYKLDGAQQTLEAPTTIVFQRHGDAWRIALIHTVPLPDETNA